MADKEPKNPAVELAESEFAGIKSYKQLLADEPLRKKFALYDHKRYQELAQRWKKEGK